MVLRVDLFVSGGAPVMFRRRRTGRGLATLALGCALVSSVGAGEVPERRAAPQELPSAAQVLPSSPYQVDVAASRVYVKVTAKGLGHSHGVMGKLASGSAVLGGPQGSRQLVFDLTSFVADPPEARRSIALSGTVSDSERRTITKTMLGPGVLDVSHYPRAIYTMTSVTPLDRQAPGTPGRYQVDGRLVLHGVGQMVRFVARVKPTDTPGVMRMRGQFSVLQTDYGITPYSALLGVVSVADQVQISGDLRLVPRTVTRSESRRSGHGGPEEPTR